MDEVDNAFADIYHRTAQGINMVFQYSSFMLVFFWQASHNSELF
jgi:hypothetical protein